ncbi:hypothetical protein AGMMS49965_20140 [Bacteroidia bacterium]|nr:hypothetical protein AGMMS49965_20140 [Bacteroidia bacterium]
MDKLLKMSGTLHLIAFDKQGAKLWESEAHNLIVDTGYNLIARALGDGDDAKIVHVAVGTNGTPPAFSDTEITDAVLLPIRLVEYLNIATVRFNFKIGYEDCVGMSIQEFGLVTANNTLFSRKVRQPLEKTNEMQIVGYWDIVIFDTPEDAANMRLIEDEAMRLTSEEENRITN